MKKIQFSLRLFFNLRPFYNTPPIGKGKLSCLFKICHSIHLLLKGVISYCKIKKLDNFVSVKKYLEELNKNIPNFT